jgi:tryptophan synthase alpha chain
MWRAKLMFKKNIFMPFVVLGDPTYNKSIKIIKNLINNGAGALELGFAFSDPIADGPVIQKANNRALENGITTSKSFEILKEIRNYSNIPISLMLSYNLVFKYGTEKFYKKCYELKIDAVLCPDVPIEESNNLMIYSKKFNISQIFLVSPTTTINRLKKIKKLCKGYVYLVSLLGTTGEKNTVNQKLPKLIKMVKKEVNLPIYVGFGISKPEHVKEVLNMGADGAICGSAICKLIENKKINSIGEFCKKMSDDLNG